MNQTAGRVSLGSVLDHEFQDRNSGGLMPYRGWTLFEKAIGDAWSNWLVPWPLRSIVDFRRSLE